MTIAEIIVAFFLYPLPVFHHPPSLFFPETYSIKA